MSSGNNMKKVYKNLSIISYEHINDILHFEVRFNKNHTALFPIQEGLVDITIKYGEDIDSMTLAMFNQDGVKKTDIIGVALNKGYRVRVSLIYVLESKIYYFQSIHIGITTKLRKMVYELDEIKDEPIEYIDLRFGPYLVGVQRDGFVTYTAPTGEGKTFFALNNLDRLYNEFDRIVILAYEITERDYMNRLMQYHSYGAKSYGDVVLMFGKKVIISFHQDIAQLRKLTEGFKRVAFIVDNIDNISLQKQEEAFYQAEWLRDFDQMLKELGHFAIVLSQLNNKRTNEKKKDLNINHVAGSKERVDLARSVFLTYYDEDKNDYEYKCLKVGTAYKNRTITGFEVFRDLKDPSKWLM
ncbi:MAG: hypothetical protein GX132_01485 [Erysipelotrichia bacterium]|jgi:KaiC/GvpD/RAD55 family RecA-like ATPase|nr:hypothetical protein [Erysipelotrichia bacterium]